MRNKCFHFNIEGEGKFAIAETSEEENLSTVLLYLFEVKLSDILVRFRFSSQFIANTTIEIFESPTITSDGTILIGHSAPISLNLYKNPTVTVEGQQIYATNPYSLSEYMFTFNASTNYLLKITPINLSENTYPTLSTDLENLKSNLGDINNSIKSRSDLTSIINSINNNTFTNDDIIPTIKKLAIVERSIINMLNNIS